MKHFPHPYLIYVDNHEYGTHLIKGLEYSDFKLAYDIWRNFRVFSDDPNRRFGDYYHVVYERPRDRFYFFYINLGQDLSTQLNLLRFFPEKWPAPKPLELPADVHADIKAGRVKILLDYSVEGIPGSKYNKQHLLKFLGEYAKYTILVTSDYRCGISRVIPTVYRNYWERHVSGTLRWPGKREAVDKYIKPKLETKTLRPFKCLMKNRIMKGHRLALSYAISQDPDLAKHINYSMSSRATYDPEETEEEWLERCLTHSKKAAEFLDMDNVYPVLDYAQKTHNQNLVGEEGLDLSINQGPVYEESLFKIHSDAYFQLVTETHFEENSLFFSEKTFQPIMMRQPFILAAEYGMVALLREFGYDVFDDIIDHSYDLERDPTERMSMLLKELRRLCNIDTNTWAHGMVRLAPRFDENVLNLIDCSYRHNDLDVCYEPREFPYDTTETPGQSD